MLSALWMWAVLAGDAGLEVRPGGSDLRGPKAGPREPAQFYPCEAPLGEGWSAERVGAGPRWLSSEDLWAVQRSTMPWGGSTDGGFVAWEGCEVWGERDACCQYGWRLLAGVGLEADPAGAANVWRYACFAESEPRSVTLSDDSGPKVTLDLGASPPSVGACRGLLNLARYPHLLAPTGLSVEDVVTRIRALQPAGE